MAKSKSGGTRSYIRGKVGADVYSVGKDGNGKKQQVVRSLAETVANPRTVAQMRGRMIMTTLMQAVAQLRPVIDHSFDGISGKQPNVSEFIRLNYAKIKADVQAHPASANIFGLNKFGEKGAKQGAYQISSGKINLPLALALAQNTGIVSIGLTAQTMTVGGLKAALGLTTEEYFTLVGINTSGEAKYERFRVNPALADSTEISSANIATIFVNEGNVAATVGLSTNTITITLAGVANCCALIVSKVTTDGYAHNKATLGAGTGLSFTANVALPTYPEGSADYLNGGDLVGATGTDSGSSSGGTNPPSGGGGGDGGDDGDGD